MNTADTWLYYWHKEKSLHNVLIVVLCAQLLPYKHSFAQWKLGLP